MFRLVLLVHVLGAIVAVGFSLSYGLWLGRGEVAGAAERVFALRTISWIDRRMTTPAYVLQVITGVALVALTHWDRLRQSWLELSILLYLVLVVLAIVRYAPAHRRQTALAERLAGGEDVADDYRSAAAIARTWGIVVTILTLAIVVLMVAKPIWW